MTARWRKPQEYFLNLANDSVDLALFGPLLEPFHLFRYVDEQVFRFNNRATRENLMNDADRFKLALSQIAGKRLTFAEVTGKTAEENV